MGSNPISVSMDDDVQPEGMGFKYTGPWVNCPECESEDAFLRVWGEGVDSDFHCPECDARRSIR